MLLLRIDREQKKLLPLKEGDFEQYPNDIVFELSSITNELINECLNGNPVVNNDPKLTAQTWKNTFSMMKKMKNILEEDNNSTTIETSRLI